MNIHVSAKDFLNELSYYEIFIDICINLKVLCRLPRKSLKIRRRRILSKKRLKELKSDQIKWQSSILNWIYFSFLNNLSNQKINIKLIN